MPAVSLPRLSVVVPSYNQGRFLGDALDSLFRQDYPHLEVVVMDGGSTDNTLEVVAPYRDRFSYFVSATDRGQSDALHRGFGRATGEIMGYLNSDDMLAPGALRFVAEYFAAHPRVDVIYSHRCIVDKTNKANYYWYLPGHHNYLMMRWDLIPQETCFWRRRVFEKAGNIDPTYQFAMDYDLFVRFMRSGAKFVRVNRFLGAFRTHGDSKSILLLETVGGEEMQRVWRKYRLGPRPWEVPVGRLFSWIVTRRGFQYQGSGRPLPGTLANAGYDYNDVWGGRLDAAEMPRRLGLAR